MNEDKPRILIVGANASHASYSARYRSLMTAIVAAFPEAMVEIINPDEQTRFVGSELNEAVFDELLMIDAMPCVESPKRGAVTGSRKSFIHRGKGK